MDDKLKKDVEELVNVIFSQKEEAEQRAETEKALNKSADTISDLIETLEAKKVELEEASTKISDLELEKSDLESEKDKLNSELEAAQNTVTETAEKLANAEKEIEEMKKDKAAEVRMADLEQSGVVLSDREVQRTKVREMEDEEFANYKAELISLREAVKAELEKEEVDNQVSDDSDKASSDDDVADDVLPAQVDDDVSSTAAMNLESASVSNSERIKRLGKALASRMKSDN
jgi:chromosome segregation ATPase